MLTEKEKCIILQQQEEAKRKKEDEIALKEMKMFREIWKIGARRKIYVPLCND